MTHFETSKTPGDVGRSVNFGGWPCGQGARCSAIIQFPRCTLINSWHVLFQKESLSILTVMFPKLAIINRTVFHSRRKCLSLSLAEILMPKVPPFQAVAVNSVSAFWCSKVPSRDGNLVSTLYMLSGT